MIFSMIKKDWFTHVVKVFRQKKTRKFLIILLAIDLFFVPIHFIHSFTDSLNSDFFNIKTDLGLAESFGYLKWILCIFLLYKLRKIESSRLYYIWMVIFLYIWLDDMFRGHERLGWHIANLLDGEVMGLRPQPAGEFLALMFSGLAILVAVGLSFFYGSKFFKKFSFGMILIFFILGFFVIGLDAIHTMNSSDSNYDFWMGLLENGGEMLVSSFVVAYIYGTYHHRLRKWKRGSKDFKNIEIKSGWKNSTEEISF